METLKPPSHVSKVRQAVSSARSEMPEAIGSDADAMRNLAYVVSSANDNIQALQRTVKQQEKELNEKTDQCSALQRNYETLARIRQADQTEFVQLKARFLEQQAANAELRVEVESCKERTAVLEEQLSSSDEVRSELAELQKQMEDVTRARDALKTELEQVGARG